MLPKEKIEQFRAMFNQSAEQLRAYLEHRQAEIEKETGIKPSLEELYVEFRGNIERELGIESNPQSLLFPEGLPGVRIDELGYFIPNIPLLSTIPNWEYGFFPTELSDKDRTDLRQLYCDPRFQRLSYRLMNRLVIIAYNEGMNVADLFAKIGLPDDDAQLHEFFQLKDEPDKTQLEVLQRLIDLYGEKYCTNWIVNNDPPTGSAFLNMKWVSGFASVELWWREASRKLAEQYEISQLSSYSHGLMEKKLNWMYSLPKFKKLSSSLHGRMDIICRIELLSREQMAAELGLDENELDHPEEYHEEITQKMLERFGDEYGAAWIAYGIGSLDTAFAWQLLNDDHAFLRRVPALFRKAGRTYISYAAARAENRLNDEERECLNCGNPMKGRIDKQFCCGACQRIYYYHKQNGQVLNGINQPKTENTEEQKEEPKEKSGFNQFLEGPIGQIATGAIKAIVDRGMNKLGDELFGPPGK